MPNACPTRPLGPEPSLVSKALVPVLKTATNCAQASWARLQFGLQFTIVRCRSARTGQGSWSSLNQSEHR